MKQILKMFLFTIQMSIMFYLAFASIEFNFNANKWTDSSIVFLLVIHNLLWISCGVFIFIFIKMFKKP